MFGSAEERYIASEKKNLSPSRRVYAHEITEPLVIYGGEPIIAARILTHRHAFHASLLRLQPMP